MQRVSLEGTVASLSAISALIVAGTSLFTAAQALSVSQAAAQQKIFENQLGVCMQFGDLTAKATTDGEKNAELLEGEMDDAAIAQLEANLAASNQVSQDLHRQYLQMTMLLPDEVSDAAYAALEKRTEIYNAQVDVYGGDAVTPEQVQRLIALGNQEEELLIAASDACRAYVAEKAGMD